MFELLRHFSLTSLASVAVVAALLGILYREIAVRGLVVQGEANDTALTRVLAETGFAPELLELELTEGMPMHNVEEAVRTMSRLHATSLRLAIDDFGTGCSSLLYLKRFPIHTLKIDRPFVRDIHSGFRSLRRPRCGRCRARPPWRLPESADAPRAAAPNPRFTSS